MPCSERLGAPLRVPLCLLPFQSVLLLDAPVTVREVMTHEEVPLADVFREVGLFLIGREDVVLFGARRRLVKVWLSS